MKSKEPIDTRSWCVALFTASKQRDDYTVRLFKNPDTAISYYSRAARTTVIYASAGEMAARLSPASMKKYIADITQQFQLIDNRYKTCKLPKDRVLKALNGNAELYDRTKLSQHLWGICHLVGDVVKGNPDSPENEDKFRIMIDYLTSNKGKEIWEEFPRQAQVLAQALIDKGEEVLEESEIHEMVLDLAKRGVLKTKQDPIKIWAYYAPLLGDKAFIYYPGKRHKLDSHEEVMGAV